MARIRGLLAVATATIAVAATAVFAVQAQAAVPGAPAGMTTVFSDDFTGAAGSGLNTANWLYDLGTSYPGGAGNWTSGRVEPQRTDFAAPAGGKVRLEARLQQPNVSGAAAAGYWPAFWSMGAPARPVGATNWPSIGEIDIMEDINGLSSLFGTLHCGPSIPGTCNETTGIGSGQQACPGRPTAFHT